MEHFMLGDIPPLMPHVESALADLERAGYRLAVICNTGLAGRRILGGILELSLIHI